MFSSYYIVKTNICILTELINIVRINDILGKLSLFVWSFSNLKRLFKGEDLVLGLEVRGRCLVVTVRHRWKDGLTTGPFKMYLLHITKNNN